jgi:hypothetical protein
MKMKRCSRIAVSACAIVLVGAVVALVPAACQGGVVAHVGPSVPSHLNLVAEVDYLGHQYYQKYGYEYACPEEQYGYAGSAGNTPETTADKPEGNNTESGGTEADHAAAQATEKPTADKPINGAVGDDGTGGDAEDEPSYDYQYEDGYESEYVGPKDETPTRDAAVPAEAPATSPIANREPYDFEYGYEEYLLKYGYVEGKPAAAGADQPDKATEKATEGATEEKVEEDSEDATDEYMTPEPWYDHSEPGDEPKASDAPDANAYKYTYPEERYGYLKAMEGSPKVESGAGTCFDHGSVPEEPRGCEYSGMHEYYGGQEMNGAETHAEGPAAKASEERSSCDEKRFYYDQEPSYHNEQGDYLGVKPSEPFAAERVSTGGATLGAVLSLAADSLECLGGALVDVSRHLRSLK